MSSTETFQHYQVLKNPDGSLCELGRGAMGVTYKAFDTSLRCHVALKVINTAYLDSEMAGQRFLREARAAAGLSHPNVASVFHLGQEGGNYFYAMEYINGETLEALIRRRGPLPVVTALKLTLQIARALRAAARLGLVHRDIKPANLMLVREDEEDTDDDELHVKVIDFGLAKVTRKEGADGANASASITIGGFVGTPHFASPEQLEEKDLDARSDIYSLGVTLWYMLMGRPPFSGSMVQVMSQHLTRRPPFEQLPAMPAPALKVLERMLEKEPASRQQTPSELRREIEQAILALGATPPPTVAEAEGPRPTEPPGESAPVTPTEISDEDGSSSSNPVTARQPEPGVVLDGRYQLLRQVSQSERGTLFQASDLDTRRVAAVKILAPELLPDAGAFQKARVAFDKARAAAHPALLQLFALARSGAQTFLVYEWVGGCSLVDVLRQRPVLSADEVIRLLRPLAAGADVLRAAGIEQPPEIHADKVLLAFADAPGAATQAALIAQPFAQWPPFTPKLLPVRLQPEPGSSATWAGLQTIVPARATPPTGAAQLALLAYELLGGNPGSFQATRRYAPLPTLGERGNDVLRDTWLGAGDAAAGSATAFVDALEDAVHPGGSRDETAFRPRAAAAAIVAPAPAEHHSSAAGTVPPPVRIGPAPVPPPSASAAPPFTPTAPVSAAYPPTPFAPAGEPSQPGGIPLAALAGAVLILILLLGAIAYVGLGARKPPRQTQNPTPAVPAGTPVVSNPPETPIAQAIPRSANTPPLSTPRASATPAQPTRAARLAAALAEARRMQDNKQTADAFTAYVRIAEEFPESDEGLGRIDSYLSALRAEPLNGDLEQRRFEQMRPSIERAARLGSDMAMLFLGDHLLLPEPATAAQWYQMAADKGRPEAMLTLGDMYFLGVGVPADPSQTAHWYELASDKGYVKAKLNLAECYESGKGGVQTNFKRSFELLREALALEPSNPRALEKMALAYEAGHGVAPNAQQAFALMKRASEQGNTNATANLGVYYINGFGAPKNERLASALFKEGAEKNNAACMFFYARCLDAGLGAVGTNKAEAATFFRAAAERGFPPAKEYCQRNKIGFVQKN